MERRVIMKRLAMRNDQLSLQLAPDDDAMEETATTHAKVPGSCILSTT
jgi:hypothetical protein